jgi:ABC-type dipeptide/oligopeptide/nickel transport system permease subunit
MTSDENHGKRNRRHWRYHHHERARGHRRSWKDTTGYVVFQQFCRNKFAIAGLIIILLMVFMAIFAPLLAPYDYKAIDPINANQAPDSRHLFGTDTQGRDILSRIIYGARYSLSIGVLATALGTVMGVILGCLAGYFSGKVETVIMRLCDVFQSIPNILLCIIISQAFGGGFFMTAVALSIYTIPIVVRLLRASILSIREQEFIDAAKLVNCGKMRIMVRHILPNCLAPVIVTFSTSVGMKILSSAGLSFLGLGIQEPMPEWGAMIATGKKFLRYYPYLVIFPGIFIALVVLSFNMVGDGLRDALDPKLRR